MSHACRANDCIPPIHCERLPGGELIGNVKPDDPLTFAEACSNPKGYAEVKDRNGNWETFDPCKDYQAIFLSCASFRRVRPRRSRVQEMAEAESISYARDRRIETTTAHYIRAIWSVCEWLRKSGYGQCAEDVDREFLEPR